MEDLKNIFRSVMQKLISISRGYCINFSLYFRLNSCYALMVAMPLLITSVNGLHLDPLNGVFFHQPIAPNR